MSKSRVGKGGKSYRSAASRKHSVAGGPYGMKRRALSSALLVCISAIGRHTEPKMILLRLCVLLAKVLLPLTVARPDHVRISQKQVDQSRYTSVARQIRGAKIKMPRGRGCIRV